MTLFFQMRFTEQLLNTNRIHIKNSAQNIDPRFSINRTDTLIAIGPHTCFGSRGFNGIDPTASVDFFRSRRNFNDIAVMQFTQKRCFFFIDQTPLGTITDLGMYRIRKIECHRSARKGKGFSFRRKNTDIFAEKIIFDQFVKRFDRFVLILKIMEPIETDRVVPATFVLPVCCNTEFCRFMHLVRTNLHFENCGRVNYTRMQCLISVLFWNRNIVFET